MTVEAIAALTGLNVAVAGVGAAVLWGLRGWRWWTDLVRLLGLAYLLGLAPFVTLATLALAVGVPFGWPLLLGLAVGLVGGGLTLGRLRGHARPGLRPQAWRPPALGVFAALWVAGIVLFLEAFFRSARLAGESEWDAWRCWSLRAKAIDHADGFDREVFALDACPGYPPGWSLVEAAGFRAMGSVDVVTVHLQYWFLTVAFVGAVAALLAPRVRQAILAPFLLLLLVLPSVAERAADGRADLPLAYLTVVGALLVVLWLEDGRAWRLPAATILFSAALLTKREGLLLVAVVLAAALACSWRERRRAWPRLAATGALAVALSLPWRIWLSAEELRSGAPPEGYLGALDDLDRAWPSLELVLRTFFDPDLWLLATPLALAAAVLAFLAGGRREAVFVATFAAAGVVACSWAIWSEPSLEITQDFGLNPVVRLVGGPVIVLLAVTPLLVERAAYASARAGWTAAAWRWAAAGSGGVVSWAIVAAALLGYPLSMLTGYEGLRLPGGSPPFPSPEECVVVPSEGAPVRVVLGYRDTYPEAFALRDRARGGGLESAEIEPDGCGRLRVFVGGAADEVLADAAALGLEPTLEG